MASKKEQLYALDIFIYNKIKFFSKNENSNGYCNMLNKTFAEETGRTTISISRSISKLLKLGYIENIGNKQFRRLKTTDKNFTYDKFINKDDKIINNLDKIINNLDKDMLNLINNLDKPELTILINLINNLDKQRIMNLIMSINNDLINKKEKSFLEQKENKKDIFCNTDFEKCFKLYQEKCKNLIPLGFVRRNRKILEMLSDFLEEIEYDFDYFEKLCIKANELKTIVDTKIDFKMMINNHEGIMNGKYTKVYLPPDLSKFNFD